MCYHTQQSKSFKELEHRFKATFEQEELFKPGIFNGFEFPETPVITNEAPGHFQFFRWGLLPSWAKDNSIRKHTLNARIETIAEKPSFKGSLQQRCLIPADGFFEWQWLDAKGKQKQKYLLRLPEGESFAFAGLWNVWTDRQTGEIIPTYTILTTTANELMSRIHNIKQRMPVIVAEGAESKWLADGDLLMQNERLQAEAL